MIPTANTMLENIIHGKWIQYSYGAVATVIVWQLDLLPRQSVPITTDVVSSNLDQGEAYNIM
jgi:hypothetical protein